MPQFASSRDASGNADSPRSNDFARLLSRRWETLPQSVQTPNQLAGVGGIACGATHGVLERCNFACTSCYLTDIANKTKPLPFEEVKLQLDKLRAELGPGGKAQITAGEVTLLPLEELGQIVAYAVSIGLDPMVMTNGERILNEPDYLVELVARYGLRKISIHIDSTQRGRPGWRADQREPELNELRERFADLLNDVRRETGIHLHAAHTITVTEDNVDDVPSIVAWALSRPDAFRLLSFLPVAPVGRTEDQRAEALSIGGLWERMCQPFGRTLNRNAMLFGHPECNVTVPLMLVSLGDKTHALEVARPGVASEERLLGDALRVVSTRIDLDDSLGRNILRGVFAVLTSPALLFALARYLVTRTWAHRGLILPALGSLLRGRLRVRPWLLVIHKFMTAEELETPVGKERLDACVFKVPVDGVLTSMCELNATGMRYELNEAQLKHPAATVPS